MRNGIAQWRVVCVEEFGADHPYKDDLFDSREEALEVCELLDDKYDTDGYYVPQLEPITLSQDYWVGVLFTKPLTSA